jgi:hypothetical protein
VPSAGGADRSQSGRPRQAWEQVPPAGRPAGHPADGRPVGRQHPRLGAAGTYGGRRPSRQGSSWSSWSAPQAPGQAPPGQGLRLPAVPRGASPTWDHAQDRPAWRGAKRQAGPPPLGDRAVASVAGGLPAPAAALRAARRHPARVPPPRLCADLPQVIEPLVAGTVREVIPCRCRWPRGRGGDRPAAALLCAVLRQLAFGACCRRHGGVRSSRVCPLARMVSDATSAGIRTLR